jgi:hypothetical protein
MSRLPLAQFTDGTNYIRNIIGLRESQQQIQRNKIPFQKQTLAQADKKFPPFMDLKIHYVVKNSPPPVRSLSLIDPNHTLTPYFLSVLHRRRGPT